MQADYGIVRAGSIARSRANRLSKDASARVLPVEVGGRAPIRAAAHP